MKYNRRVMSHGISRIPLAWGGLTAEFEPDTGWLRQVVQGERLLIRAVYAAVRHEDWSTPEPKVTVTLHRQEEGTCELEWVQDYPELGFAWRGAFKGCCDGSCMISGKGSGGTTFLTRRTGICLLHPSEQKGLVVTVTHQDGGQTTGSFPCLIAPHQPFFDIQGLAIPSVGELAFEGEVFEMEDQRNWSDASYKTYCRPHTWPSPYQVEAGTSICQKIILRPEGETDALPLPIRKGVFPELCAWVRPYDHAPDWKGLIFADLLADEWSEAQLGPLEGNRLIASWRPGLTAPECRAALVLPEHEAAARSAFAPGTPIYAWHGGNFTELNRAQPLADSLDGLAFRVCCQVHTEDDASVLENTLALTDVVESAAALAKGRPVIVAPLQFGNTRHGSDFRKKGTLVGAQWSLLSLLHLGLGGRCLAVPFEAGELMWGGLDQALWLNSLAGQEIELLAGSVPGRAMGFSVGGRRVVFNLTPERLTAFEVELSCYQARWL